MATNLALDDELIDEARRIGNHETKKAAVTAALEEYIARRKQVAILKLSGTIDYDPAYDYKKVRRRDTMRIKP
ncbi:MAG: type II toxin-antitoxin system VapB family antitoxin [Terracidiphilus sp.]|jgi:Arc/MetJ family transcription regulator